jgi:integrase
LADKRIHPHSLRHTTDIHLLNAGVGFAAISLWLGHANLNTTMRYARADIGLKSWQLRRRHLSGHCHPSSLSADRSTSWRTLQAST